MDAVTIGIVAAGITSVIVSYFVFQWATRDSAIGESYKPATLRLFADEKAAAAKTKGKPSKAKKPVAKERKEKGPSLSIHEQEEGEEGSVAEAPAEQVPAPQQQQPKSDDAPKKGKKRQHKKAHPSESESGHAAEEDEQAGEWQPASAAPSRKTPSPLAAPAAAVEPKAIVKEAKQQHSAPAPPTVPAPPTAPPPPAQQELSIGKVLARIKALAPGAELEPECVGFLAKYEADAKARAKEHETHRASAQQKERALQSLVQEVSALQCENGAVRADLKAQCDKYETFETSARSKLGEIGQLKAENKRLNETLTQNYQKLNSCGQMVRDVEHLRHDLDKEKSAAAEQVAASKKVAERLQAENAELAKAYHAAEAERARSKDQELKGQELQAQVHALQQELERAIAATKKAHSLHQGEKEKVLSDSKKAHEEAAALKKRLQEAEAQRDKSSAALGQLQRQLDAANGTQSAQDGELQAENAELAKKLDITQKKLQDMLAYYAAAEKEREQHKKLQAESAALAKKLEATQLKLQDMLDYYNASQKERELQEKVVARSRELEAEIRRLKAEQPANNVGSLSNHQAPNPQLEEQKQRNQELRDANYRLVETVQAQEAQTKKLLGELESKLQAARKEVADSTASVIGAAAPKGNIGVEEYTAWLRKAVALEKGRPAATSQPQQPQQPGEVARLEGRLEQYTRALDQLRGQLALVESVAREVEAESHEKIQRLEQQLAKQRSPAH